ncbi:MAG: hypothetical protein WCA77_08545, partial [Thermoplasmata archaeon]
MKTQPLQMAKEGAIQQDGSRGTSKMLVLAVVAMSIAGFGIAGVYVAGMIDSQLTTGPGSAYPSSGVA